MSAGKGGQFAYWNGPMGQGWAAQRAKRDRDHAPLTKALLELSAPQPGERVLDIGCGSGTTTLALAERVAPKGSVLGIDISKPMLEVARSRAAELRSTAEFVEADITHYPFVAHSFDLGFSQLGVMFFPDPIAAFRNIHAAMKPHARLVFCCWRHPSEHLWAFIPESAAKHFLPPAPPADPDAPGRYSFQNPDRVRSVLLQAGFVAPEFQKFDFRTYAGASPEEAASSAIDEGPLARSLVEVDEDTRAKVRAAVTERLAKERGPDGIWLTSAAWLVQAHA
jgi:SAM-dependent methyltransferase